MQSHVSLHCVSSTCHVSRFAASSAWLAPAGRTNLDWPGYPAGVCPIYATASLASAPNSLHKAVERNVFFYFVKNKTKKKNPNIFPVPITVHRGALLQYYKQNGRSLLLTTVSIATVLLSAPGCDCQLWDLLCLPMSETQTKIPKLSPVQKAKKQAILPPAKPLLCSSPHLPYLSLWGRNPGPL